MMVKLLLLFTVVPTLELLLLLQIGSLIGPLYTVILILLTGAVGAWLAKREGLAVIRTLKAELARGLPPAARLAEAALVLSGGLLLVTPGVMTDLVGFALVIPYTRRMIAPWLIRVLAARFQVEIAGASEMAGAPPPPRPPDHTTEDGRRSPFDHPIR